MSKQRKINFQQKYVKNTVMSNINQLDQILKESIEIHMISQQVYDDELQGLTINIVFKKSK